MAQRKHLGAELGVGAGADEDQVGEEASELNARPRSMAGNPARSTRPSAAKTLCLAGLPAVGSRGANSNGRWAVYPTGARRYVIQEVRGDDRGVRSRALRHTHGPRPR